MVVYPGDWVKSTIGECADIYQGGTPSTTNSEYWGGDIVLLTPGEITKLKTLYVNNSERKITQEGLNDSSATLLPTGTILLCTRATIGELAIAAKPVTTNQGFKNLVCKDWIDNKFLAYLLTTYKDEMISRAIGTTFLELSKKELSRLTVHLPPLQEQRAIAEALTAFDDYIADLDALIEKKKAIRDGALKDLVSGRTRLAGFDGEWSNAKIGDILKVLHGKNQHLIESLHGHYPIMGTGGIIGWTDKYLCDWECVLIGRKGTIDRPYYMNVPFWTIDTLYYSEPMPGQCVKYQYYLFSTIPWYDFTESSGRPSLTRKAIEGIEIVLPPSEEQKAIADILSSMDNEIKSLEVERDKMIQVREGAMDDLLTGRVRLSV